MLEKIAVSIIGAVLGITGLTYAHNALEEKSTEVVNAFDVFDQATSDITAQSIANHG